MPELSRRKIIGGSVASSVALLTGKAGAAATSEADKQPQTFKTNGARAMTLEEFRALNGPGSVARLMGEMNCDVMGMCHKRIEEEQGVWIPELVPIFKEIDARTGSHPAE